MNRIILQPSGNKDARDHYFDTITNRVPLERIRPFLTAPQNKDLLEIYPCNSCHIWGVTPGGSNITKWDRIQRGDVTLFSSDGRIYASAVTTYKIHNKKLAAELWNFDKSGETWEYIYFIEEIRSLNIPYINFNKSVGYADNYVIQGFNVLSEAKSNSVFSHFDLHSDSFVEEIDLDSFNALLTKIENLEETERQIVTTQRLEQSYLKQFLFGNNTNGQCACCHKVYPVSYLVTAHIKKRSSCSPQEKRDINVVMPMCKFGCDELFEKGYVSVNDGKFIDMMKNPTSTELQKYLDIVSGKSCSFFNQKTIAYFNWHLKHHG